MGNINLAIEYATKEANDNRYGYSQERRDWPLEDDCSSGTMGALRYAGYAVNASLTTANMLIPLLAAGFRDVTASVNLRTGKGLQAGDIVLRPKTSQRGGHTAIMVSATQLVQFQGDFDGKPGDSSGREIMIKDYYDSPFTYVLRDPAYAAQEYNTQAGTVIADVNGRSEPDPTQPDNIIKVFLPGAVIGFNGKRQREDFTWLRDSALYAGKELWIRSDFISGVDYSKLRIM